MPRNSTQEHPHGARKWKSFVRGWFLVNHMSSPMTFNLSTEPCSVDGWYGACKTGSILQEVLPNITNGLMKQEAQNAEKNELKSTHNIFTITFSEHTISWIREGRFDLTNIAGTSNVPAWLREQSTGRKLVQEQCTAYFGHNWCTRRAYCHAGVPRLFASHTLSNLAHMYLISPRCNKLR